MPTEDVPESYYPAGAGRRAVWRPLHCSAVAVAVWLIPVLCATAYRVEVHKTDEGWQLLRDGKPFYIKGVAGTKYLDLAAEAGANAVRTWDSRFLQRVLDPAQKYGLAVCAGLWMPQLRHGFDYSDHEAVERVKKKLLARVVKHKEHPNLLMWVVGNEVVWADVTNRYAYAAIEEIARAVKALDPNHPVATVVADLEPGGIKARMIKAYCPSVDILGVNSYGGLRTLPDRLRAAGWVKPYMVTEFGPPGPWESRRAAWGSAVELTSTEKGRYYYEGYLTGVASQTNWSLGAFVFYWGTKGEETPTWFGMFLPGGVRLAPVDYMQFAWTGKWPDNRCPEILYLRSPVALRSTLPGKSVEVTYRVSDPEGDPLTERWYLTQEIRRPDPKNPKLTLVSWKDIPAIKVRKERPGRAWLTVPNRPGIYRLHLEVRDDAGGGATANFPFKVGGR